jgi:hypothetical protein
MTQHLGSLLRQSRQRVAIAAAAVLAASAVPLGVGAFGAAGAESSAPAQIRVAAAQIHEMRAVVTATRTGGTPATATVRLHVLTRRAGGWHDAGTVVVGKRKGWFWNVLRGRGAVCGFSVAGAPERSIDLQLLITPSVGCAATRHFHVEGGQLVKG